MPSASRATLAHAIWLEIHRCFDFEKELLRRRNAVSVGLGYRCAAVLVSAGWQGKKGCKIKPFSPCCVLVREAAT